MNDTFIIECLYKEESNGKNEDSEHTKELNAEIHSYKSKYGMDTDIH